MRRLMQAAARGLPVGRAAPAHQMCGWPRHAAAHASGHARMQHAEGLAPTCAAPHDQAAHTSAQARSTPRLGSHILGDQSLLRQLQRPPAAFAEGEEVMDSIIKIFTVMSRPNHMLPWQNHGKTESLGSGFVVHERFILTNAHVVANATYVAVKRHGSGTRYRAHVQAVGHDCDLALLSVDDEAFWAQPTAMRPLKLGGMPALQQELIVVGYPTGGENTSVTSGVVSRVEMTQYVHSAALLTAIQLDAAINAGNSGGPALVGNEVAGVAFQNLPSCDSIGYVIPCSVIQHFLNEVGSYGHYRGYCSLGILTQKMDNPHLRKALKMPEGMTGVLVNNVVKTSTAAAHLRGGDVLLEFNGVPIADDGSIHLRHRERIYFSHAITLLPTGATCRVKLLRDGSVQEHSFQAWPNAALVPVHTYDQDPQFWIYAGLVFVPLTQSFLMEWGGEDWQVTCPRRLYDKAMNQLMERPGQQIVVLSQVLVDDINTGYQQLQNSQVKAVNGQEVLNLSHLQALVHEHAARGDYVRLTLEDDRLIVIDSTQAADADARIADRYRLPRAQQPPAAAVAAP